VTEVIVAVIGLVGVVIVGYFEHGRRSSNARWAQNSIEHAHVIDKIDAMGRTLGISIDRVEETALRSEAKLDTHLNDHLTGRLVPTGKEEKEPPRRRRKVVA
jgi:hypothetical protein